MTKTNWGLLKIDHKLTCHKCGKTTFKKLKIKKIHSMHLYTYFIFKKDFNVMMLEEELKKIISVQ